MGNPVLVSVALRTLYQIGDSAEAEFRKNSKPRIRDRDFDAQCDEQTYRTPWNLPKSFLRSSAQKE